MTGPSSMPLHRRAALAVTLAVVALAVFPFGGAAHTCTPDPQVGVGGRLLIPQSSGLARIDLPDRMTQTLAVSPSLGVVTSVARSPDGSRLAVARFSRAPWENIGGQDILIVDPEGGQPRQVIERSRAGELLGSPAWLPDGSLVFERQSVAGPVASSRVERQSLDGADSRALVERGAFPAVSPDGIQLAFIRAEGSERLLITDLNGGPERVLADDPLFLSLAFPRFSPDGSWIAFSAASDPSVALTPHAPSLRLGRGGEGVRAALAHGIPWDIWLVRPDGSERRRLTYFYDDDPAAAWSPDGRWLAILSGEALHVVAVDGPANFCIAASGGYGGLEWLP